MSIKKLLLLAVTVFCTVSLHATKGDEVWKSVVDWMDYCPHSEMGYVISYALVDVDNDGISECFVKGEYENYAFLTCSDGKGNVGKGYIKPVVISAPTMWLYIARSKGKCYVLHQGGCGTGCGLEEYYKIENSTMQSCYTCLTTIGLGDNPETTMEYMLIKPGDEPRNISSVLYEKNTPKNPAITDILELEWTEIAEDEEEETPTVQAPADVPDTITDANGYVYTMQSNGTLAVAPGGNYTGNIVIPETVSYGGNSYKVTTVRRETFYKRPEATNIGTITSITLPESVTLVGTDAFRDNPSLTSVKYGKNTRIEVRSFWGCPKLKITPLEPVFAFTGPFDVEYGTKYQMIDALSQFYVPVDKEEKEITGYQWAVHKHNHNGIRFQKWNNIDSEKAIPCYCWDTDFVRCGLFGLLDKSNAETMFKGYMHPSVHVLLADNSFVATHEFPIYSRWVSGEEEKSMPDAFKQAMAKRFGRKIKYSYEIAKLAYTSVDEQLVITEFEVKNHVAMYVLTWLRDGKEVCSYAQTTEIESEFEDSSVWNVDDDGNYGIPALLSIARDEQGNVELFLCHDAPESMNFSHLVQKGDKFIKTGDDQWYIWIDPPVE